MTLKMIGWRVYWLPFIPYLPVKFGEYFYSTYARNYWQGQLKKMLERAGFTIVERSYIWPTFEGISGKLPGILKPFRPLLRFLGNTLEKTIFLKRFGMSQVFVCRKGPSKPKVNSPPSQSGTNTPSAA